MSGVSVTSVVRVRQLGLAAYVKMSGAKLLGVENRVFLLETDVPLEEWRLRYNNSCCMKHDALVCEMRNFLNVPCS